MVIAKFALAMIVSASLPTMIIGSALAGTTQKRMRLIERQQRQLQRQQAHLEEQQELFRQQQQAALSPNNYSQCLNGVCGPPNYFNPGGILTPLYLKSGLCVLGDAACPIGASPLAGSR